MKLNLRTIAALLGLLVATASSASALTLTLSGTLTTSDPRFNRPTSATGLSGAGTAVAYNTFTLLTDASGTYSISGDYTAGGVGTATGLDGYLFLYSAFNPATPLTGLLAADDDNDPDGAGAAAALDGSLIPSAGSYGPATTTTTLTLTPNTLYTVVISGFGNATTTTGVGPYSLTVVGATAFLPNVPEPSSLVAAAAGLAGLAAFVRRRRAA